MSKSNTNLPVVIDIGCGDNKRDPNALGMDSRAYSDVDIQHDISEIPWKTEDGNRLPSNHFERVDAYSILEHIRNLPELMAEIHRTCQDGAIINGKVPHWKDRNAYIDPTHVRFFDTRTFDFWDPRTELGAREYFDSVFHVKKARRIRRIQFWKNRPIKFELRVIK